MESTKENLTEDQSQTIGNGMAWSDSIKGLPTTEQLDQ